MKKIPTLFRRDFSQSGHPIIPEYNDGVEWVLNGEGMATRKYDGMCCMVRANKLYKRYEYKDDKIPPADFEEADYDKETSKHVGWVQVGWGSEDKWFREAIVGGDPGKVDLADGTYELLGPKVQGNPEGLETYTLQSHDDAEVLIIDLKDFDSLKLTLDALNIEGIVWHHPDGRMVKIKKKDFGLKR